MLHEARNSIVPKHKPSFASSNANRVSRRQVLQQGLVGGAALFAAPSILCGRNLSDRLNIAIIGCGGRGAANLEEVAGENIVALCDVNDNNLRQVAQRFPHARTFHDFRRMYDELTDADFDAVVVSTTEHTHAFATLPALHRKKHVYCEKPLTHNIREARIITQAAHSAGVATQMGTQIHASTNFRRVVELVQSGSIGQVHQVHVWTSRAWGWQSHAEALANGDIVSTQERPTTATEIPHGVDWDLWLGPAPERPFHEVYFPGPKWYRWWEWGSGTMSDLGSHMIDLAFWALALDAPLTIEASGPPPHADLAPASMSVSYEYGQRGDLPPVKLTWYQGTPKPDEWKEGRIPTWPDGTLFVGSKAKLLANYSRHAIIVDDGQVADFSPFTRPERSIPDSPGQHAEWLLACKTGSATGSHFGYSGPLTEANHLGNVAFRAGKKIQWDPQNMRLPGAPDAEEFLGREYRSGWSLG